MALTYQPMQRNFKESCQVLRIPSAEDYDYSLSLTGEVDEDGWTEVATYPCLVSRGTDPTSVENLGSFERGVRTVFLSPDADVKDGDRVLLTGGRLMNDFYGNVEDAQLISTLNSRTSHLEVTVTKVDRESDA